MKISDDYKTSWKSHSTKNDTPWGHEYTWGALRGINGKCLFINAGKRTSLKYYTQKDEVLFLRKGVAEVTHGDEHTLENPELFPMKTTILNEGELICLQACCPYRITAIENCEVFEIGNAGDTSIVRVEDDYGRNSTKNNEKLIENE
jgi:mannose-6-phosphate isomerase-like protein (cupin superfamily)